jgi:hypothetical protein
MVLKECPRQTNKAVFVNADSVSCHGRGWLRLDADETGFAAVNPNAFFPELPFRLF